VTGKRRNVEAGARDERSRTVEKTLVKGGLKGIRNALNKVGRKDWGTTATVSRSSRAERKGGSATDWGGEEFRTYLS